MIYNYKNCKVKYYYQPKSILGIGKTVYNYNGININIYDKERLLIELFIYSTKIPFDLYKEVINNYRNENIDFDKFDNYLNKFKCKNRIIDKVRLEVL